MEDYEEYTVTLSFYMISGSDLSQVHMVVENFGATLKHLSWRRMWPPIKDEDTLEKRCECHDMSLSSERPTTEVMARYEWTSV
jgi:hypothetical protein